jgi:hypothetical protein
MARLDSQRDNIGIQLSIAMAARMRAGQGVIDDPTHPFLGALGVHETPGAATLVNDCESTLTACA